MVHEDESTEAILLLEASNAFNSLNRQSFLHNISYYLCQKQLKIVTALHQDFFRVRGTQITSKERTTQVDLFSMTIYGIGDTPLIRR